MNRRHNGFTLLELSIVLVIIGLLAAGITAGTAIMHAAELNSVIADLQSFKAAVHTFKDKYRTLPGDMDDASSYWMGALDGDGNGEINAGTAEDLYVWQHLTLSEVLAGNYDGTVATGPSRYDLSVNVPESKRPNAGYRIFYTYTTMSFSVFNREAHAIEFGSLLPGSAHLNGAVYPPGDVRTIDLKLDDGLADAGNLISINAEGLTGCVTNAMVPPVRPSDYILSNTDDLCVVFYFLD